MPSLRKSGETWSIPGVFLLTDGSDRLVAIPDLRLDFGATGIELVKADDELAWQCSWPELGELSTAERSVLPDGREGIVVLLVEQVGRRHRFVLPTDEPKVAETRVRELATAHRVRTSEPPAAVSRTLTVAVIVATVATLTVLLLSAAHVLHF